MWIGIQDKNKSPEELRVQIEKTLKEQGKEHWVIDTGEKPKGNYYCIAYQDLKTKEWWEK